ncbi:MAG: Gfo/Idh/MocA family oxidoreductase, partial [Chloroflexi bacterium]|nr:Gfo/Idh/MocA family oxidoreductase [Chloroflexota bacterium]
MGIIGCGGIAERRHAPALAAMDRVRLVALADISQERLGWLGERCGVPSDGLYTDYESMLTAQELDIVHVCTPHDQHEAQTIAAMRSGAHVLVEKPIATAAEEADRMIKACEDKGVVLNVDHTRRWSPLHHKVRNTIRSGAIGPLGTIVATQGGPRAMLFRNGTHMIDSIVFYAESEPVQVFARLEDGFKGAKAPERDALEREQALLTRLKEALDGGSSVSDQALSRDEARLLEGFKLLTAKPLMVVANIGEGQLSASGPSEAALSSAVDIPTASLCGTLEMELAAMEPEEEREFRESL